MKLARALHFDENDQRVFHSHAQTGEWCISGGFEFSNWSEADLDGKARRAFSKDWLGMSTFGRVTFVAVTQIKNGEIDTLAQALAQHFVQYYGAPSIDAAASVARQEMMHMADLCDEHDPNTLLTVARELGEAGVHESYRVIAPQDAGLDQFAIHGSLDDDA